MKRYIALSRLAVLSAAIAVLAACASTGPAPVDDLSGASARSAVPRQAPSQGATEPVGSYRVQRGDTLYSIAFRNGVDYRELADWNGIGAPYTIYVGQEIRLAARSRSASRTPPVAPSRGAAAVATAKPATVGAPAPAPFQDVPRSSSSTTPSGTPQPGHAAPLAAATTTAAAASGADPAPKPMPVSPVPAVVAAPVAGGEVAWRWPAEGRLVGSYLAGDPTRQGIDVAGKAGDPVRAAAAGTVVYSGNGLIGYGELIIVKHSPAFLSAYGHNRQRLVKEGDRVTPGQTIAEMGSSSASRDSLHFEIRRNGKPVNPLDYLPRR